MNCEAFVLTINIRQNNDKEFILWKVGRNNNHYLVYFNKNLLNGYINLRINEKKINVISSIGSIHGIKLLNDFVKSFILGVIFNFFLILHSI